METTAARYLELLIHEFYDNLMSLQKQKDPYDDEFETLYALGYNFFTLGRYQSARDIFINLATLAPYTAHYWRALGAVNQQLKNYDEALVAYSKAIDVDESDIISRVYRGETYILMKNIGDALKDFEAVKTIGVKDEQNNPWVERAGLLIRLNKQS